MRLVLDGGGTGWVCYLTQSIGGAPYALMSNLDGSPMRFFYPGETVVNPPFVAPGAIAPSYELVCRAIGSGTLTISLANDLDGINDSSLHAGPDSSRPARVLWHVICSLCISVTGVRWNNEAKYFEYRNPSEWLGACN
jgi:hypothetical protein